MMMKLPGMKYGVVAAISSRQGYGVVLPSATKASDPYYENCIQDCQSQHGCRRLADKTGRDNCYAECADICGRRM